MQIAIIESSFALMKFMAVLMNVYLPYTVVSTVDVREFIFCVHVNEQEKVYYAPAL